MSINSHFRVDSERALDSLNRSFAKYEALMSDHGNEYLGSSKSYTPTFFVRAFIGHLELV